MLAWAFGLQAECIRQGPATRSFPRLLEEFIARSYYAEVEAAYVAHSRAQKEDQQKDTHALAIAAAEPSQSITHYMAWVVRPMFVCLYIYSVLLDADLKS